MSHLGGAGSLRRFHRIAIALALIGALAGAERASAHAQSAPIDADSVRVQTDVPPDGIAFQFSSTDEGVVSGHDPRSDGAAMLVRGVGPNAGRTPLIVLDPTKWSPAQGGFTYDDPTGARGGVTSVDYATGALSIGASFEQWAWSPAGPQDEVWVHFKVEDEWLCARFAPSNSTIQSNAAGHFEAVAASAPGSCPAQVCGNGTQEVGEECDDGNLADGDGCDPDCTIGTCNGTSFASTFEGIQKVIFESEAYGCARGSCHDSVLPDGNLDLSTEAAYESLLGPDGLGATADVGTYKRVLPTEPDESLLYLKLATRKANYAGPDVGSGMPTGTSPLSDEHLEAVRLWIRGGAPRDLVVPGTAQLLGTCFPPGDPLKTPVPNAPLAQQGVQLRQPPYPLLGTVSGQGETELCSATYYDLSQRVPPEARVPCPPEFQLQRGCSEDAKTSCTTDEECAGKGTCIVVKNAVNPEGECVAYDRITLIQDPQSHHSIINNYTGRSDTTDSKWGAWEYRFEPDDPNAVQNGQACDPTAVDPALGYNPGCGSAPTPSIACVGYGPSDLGNLNLLTGGGGGNLPQVLVSQETYYDFPYPGGVYNVLPIRGILVWNSHAFNLTPVDSTLAQFLNVEYAPEPERVHASQTIFDAKWIFAQFVAPYEKKEVCATYTAPRGAQVFQLSSHTHRHGVRWRTWGPPNEPCRPQCPTQEDDLYLGLLDRFGVCDADSALPLCTGPRTDPPLYLSSDYSDPLNLDFDPPLPMDSPSDADRTFLYCSVFDNGSEESSPPVKLWSTSPAVPEIFAGGPFLEVLGGPCATINLVCANDGPMRGQRCAPNWSPDDAFCDSTSGAGDGRCDACPVHGGVTTEDEMFILLGSYYMAPVPEPGAALLAGAAAAALAALRHRRRNA